MNQNEKQLLKINIRRKKVTKYLRRNTASMNVKKSLNITYMERVLKFRKGRLQKFASGIGSLTDQEVLIVHSHLKKLTRY